MAVVEERITRLFNLIERLREEFDELQELIVSDNWAEIPDKYTLEENVMNTMLIQKDRSKGMTVSELKRRNSKIAKARRNALNFVLANLVEEGALRCVERGAGDPGRPTRRYFLPKRSDKRDDLA